MTFNNTIAQWLAGVGIPSVYAANINVNSNLPIVLPVTGNFAPPPRGGYVRVKDNTPGAPPANSNVQIGGIIATYTDGNFSNIYAGDPARRGAGILDWYTTFWLDRPVANINITNITTDGPVRKLDIEVAAGF